MTKLEREIQEGLYDPTTNKAKRVNKKLLSKVVSKYGLTKNPFESGYLLPDGSLLNYGIWEKGESHEDLNVDKNLTVFEHQFETGIIHIRIMENETNVLFIKGQPITEKQFDKLHVIQRGMIYYDVLTIRGMPIKGRSGQVHSIEGLKDVLFKPVKVYDPIPKYRKGDKVHLKGQGMVKILGVRVSGDRIIYRVSIPGLKPREYDEYDLDYKYSKGQLEARKESGMTYDPMTGTQKEIMAKLKSYGLSTKEAIYYINHPSKLKAEDLIRIGKQRRVFYDPTSLPPTRWYEAMVKGIKKSSDVRNPYAIVKSIWAKLSPSGKAKIRARETKGEHFKYDLPLPVDKPTRGTGTVRMVKPFKLAEVQVNLSVRDYLTALQSGIFSKMKRDDGTTALVVRCKSPEKNVNVFIDKAGK